MTEQKKRTWQTVFGFLIAIAGIAAFFLVDGHSTRVHVGIVGAILLGGMYIDPEVMKDTVKTFTPFVKK